MSWGVSSEFYRREQWKAEYESLEDFVEKSYGEAFLGSNCDNLRAQLQTWYSTALSIEEMSSINARIIFMPCRHDRYFRIEDAEAVCFTILK